MMEERISVIVPVYNVLPYLRECVESILAQTYRALEVILVDDGSTDGSGALCDALAGKDSRITVAHRENGGAGAAKNTGLALATGTYLSFVDSDDYLEPGAYSHMVGLLEKYHADAVQCAFRRVFRDRQVPQNQGRETKMLTGEAFLARFPVDWTCGLLWDKLYRREIFSGVRFPEGHRIDDEYFTYRGILRAETVVVDGKIVYSYRQRASGVMASRASAQRILMDRIDYLTLRRQVIAGEKPGLRRAFDLHFLEMLLILSRDPVGSPESLAKIRQALRGYFHAPGHTPPPAALWPGLWQLGCRSEKWLLERKAAPTPPENGALYD